MKKVFISIIIVAISFALRSQDLEHSWCLFPDYGDDVSTFANLIETDEGNYIVSMYDYENYYKSEKDATIIELNSDGVIINEIDVDIDDAYILNDIVLDVWNDTVNVFMHCIGNNRDCVKMLHSHLLPDFTMTDFREIWSADFEEPMTANIISCTQPLIDANGIRTISYTYSSFFITGGYPPYYGKVIFLKLDSNCNVIVEKWIDCEELNYDYLSTVCYTFNEDSTQYNVMCSLNDNPWHCQYVLDESFNIVDTVLYEKESEMNYWGFFTNGFYNQNPNNGVIYGISSLAHPEALYEISVVKLDKTDMKVKFLQCTDTPNDIYNSIGMGNYLCYSQNGDIYGMGIYDFDYFTYNPIYECKLYIVKFDENLNKLNEWYYEIEEEYLHHFDHIYCTESDDIIVTGVVSKDYHAFPCITKFPASAFVNIEEAHSHNLKLAVAYPNPGGDVMNIRTGLRNATLSVYDIQGRKIHEQEITDDITSIDASKWNSGTYVWKLGIRNEEVEEGKWVKSIDN